ncbi:hypothetical protein V502_05440 [Pseudogymnoascus sp. VKM F-4520 (FW-2644)]|nr:hypothetical protein V502_05440 [Pseudogymnoascus sp. VKM F-4520 (FW-2644)]
MEKPDIQLSDTSIADHIEEISVTQEIAGSGRYAEKSKAERKLLLKADLVILPICSVVWWVTYLDRNSIGNARIMGLQTDLHMTADQFYNCLTMFFVGYIVLLVPANVTSRIFKPNRSVGVAVIYFGVVLCCMGVAKNYATILALRLLLGCGQAYVQFLVIYISLWYKRDEVAFRTAIFFSCSTISGGFSVLIAYGIQNHLTFAKTGRAPWSWLFIIEGCVAIGIGIIAFVLLPRLPDDLQKNGKKHWLFTKEEIDIAVVRFASYNTAHEKVKPAQFLEVIKDPKSWLFALSQGACVMGVSVVGSFLPSFISTFGFSPIQTQLFSVIPYACSFCTVLGSGFLSDRLNRKMPFLLGSFDIGCIGFILLLTVHYKPVDIFATCLITASCYTCILLVPVWLNINTVGFTKRGTTWALAEIFGLIWSIMGTRIYNTPPLYIKGHAVVLSLNCLACFTVFVAYIYMRRMNKQKERLEMEYANRGEVHPDIANNNSLEEVGEAHISFSEMQLHSRPRNNSIKATSEKECIPVIFGTMEPLPELPSTRRLVTGHNKEGKAIFDFDEVLVPVNPVPVALSQAGLSNLPLGVTLIHRTRNYPVKIQGSTEELTVDNLRRNRGEKGIVCQIVDLPPTPKGTPGFLHRNQSLDYGVVLKGSMKIILDDGVEHTLNEGDVYVQKGTMHAWKNITSEYCRFLTVVIPSEKVEVKETREFLEVSKVPGLSD